MNKEKFILWIKAAGVRSLKTFAQTLLSLITVGAAFVEIDWVYALSVSGVAAVCSLLTSIGGLPELKSVE